MPQCPQCGTDLKDDYGMITCPSCGTILFIDMDGVAHRSTDAGSSESSQNEYAQEASPSDRPYEDDPSNQRPADASEMNFVAMPPSFQPLSSSSDIESVEPQRFGEQMPDPVIDAVAAPGGEFSMDNLLGYGGERPAGAHDDPSGLGPANDPLGLAGYANSEISQAKDGPFVFRLLISGIDTKEIRESIREALQDSRFGWDTAQLMARISKGDLTIDNVSPVKAAILVNRVKRLPLRIRWEQYAITQMDNV